MSDHREEPVMDDEAILRQKAYEEHVWAQNRTASGQLCAPIASQAIDHEKMVREQRVQSAVYTLFEAKRIRADADLMALIRAHVRDKSAELQTFLDDIGHGG